MQIPGRRAAVYCRISQDRAGAGMAVERQAKDCRALVKKLGLEVVEPLYVDNDISATTGKRRPAFERLLLDASAGQFDFILAWHTDRMYRLPADLDRLVRALETHDVRVHTVESGVLDLSNPQGRLAARMFAGLYEYEVEQKKVRQRAQTLDLAEKGLPGSGPRPFGYEEGGIKLRESEATLIRDATERLLAGAPVLSLVREWNQQGIKAARGGRWTHVSFIDLMKRWRNAAIRQHQGEPIGPARWEPIVSEEDLRALRAMLSDASRRTTTDTARKHMLSFILECGRCGGPLRAGQTSSRKRKYAVYQCHGASGCRLAIMYDVATEVVSDYVATRLALPDSGLLASTASVRQELKALRRERAKLVSEEAAASAAKINPRIKLKMLEECETERIRLDSVIADLVQRQALADLLLGLAPVNEGARVSFSKVARAREQARNKFDAQTLATRKAIIRSLCRVTVLPAVKGVRYTAANSPQRIEITPLDPLTGGELPKDSELEAESQKVGAEAVR